MTIKRAPRNIRLESRQPTPPPSEPVPIPKPRSTPRPKRKPKRPRKHQPTFAELCWMFGRSLPKVTTGYIRAEDTDDLLFDMEL
ncbi:hypothetical protein SCAR479_12034 [Seiridium cardinale]|uniref:Uncharacterized protein n=1 Tax=Seiridium cardinale TaxID=138064 RepID=A0ABR2XBY2_9PEZI